VKKLEIADEHYLTTSVRKRIQRRRGKEAHEEKPLEKSNQKKRHRRGLVNLDQMVAGPRSGGSGPKKGDSTKRRTGRRTE